MTRNIYKYIATAVLLSATFAAANVNSVTLHFIDSVMVNDTIIRLGDIARINCDDAAIAAKVRNFAAGEAAPAGFSRFVNSQDLVMYRLQPMFAGVKFTSANVRRVKVISDYQARTVGEFEDEILAYAEKKLGWAKGDWTLSINNPKQTWKSGRGEVEVEVLGLDNPFAKGNTSLTLVTRQGTRVNRIPVPCKIEVKTKVLVATRPIRRGEELTKENTKFAVTDVTSFAFAPMTELPESGTMTVARSVPAGNIMHARLLTAIPLVARGDQVRIQYIGERVRISVLGVARDSGSNGDKIWVQNNLTGKLIRAAVAGKGSVVVHEEGGQS